MNLYKILPIYYNNLSLMPASRIWYMVSDNNHIIYQYHREYKLPTKIFFKGLLEWWEYGDYRSKKFF